MTGMVMSVEAAITCPQSLAYWPKNWRRPTATV
jgi:hypothetical protein